MSAGCSAQLWTGQWKLDPQGSVADRSALGNHVLSLERQRFMSAAEVQCEPAWPFLLSPKATVRGRVTDASELHASQRLRGLRGKLWLMIGTSVDHIVIRDLCGYFNVEHHVADAAATSLHPSPGLHFDYCRLPSPIDLTIVYVGYKGLTALEVQANASLQHRRFGELQHLLTAALGANHTPDFLSLGGIEWDFKQWGSQHRQPSSDGDWGAIRQSLLAQLRAARRFWPRLTARVLRTQYRTSYRWYKGWVDVDGAEYAKYNELMRGLATEGCGGVQLLDIARTMNCSHVGVGQGGAFASAGGGDASYGACGKETGWTTDGLHPANWAIREYFGLALNVLADFGEACDGV